MTVRQHDPRRRQDTTPGPRPAAIRHNDWRQVELPDPGAFAAALPVSVIVPCFEAPVTVVRQERRGFGLARARNTGVAAAAHDILVFLDSDVIPEAGVVAAHARWHHALSDALTLGFCACVSVAGIDAAAVRAHRGPLGDLFAGRPADPPWLERHMARTGDLTSRHGDLFRAVTGQNFGISLALYEEVGGFDESFIRYGGEDTEFAWRAQVRGAVLVPERGAFGWHQGRWAEGREGKARDLALQADTLAGLIAEPGFRPAGGGRFAVPRHVVTLDAGRDAVDRVIDAAHTLLADPADDVGLCLEVPPRRGGDPARQRLEQAFGEETRARIVPTGAALEAFPAAPLHLALPARAVTGPGLPARLAAALGDAASARAVLEDGTEVSIARAWVLHRVRRAGGSAADYGEVRRLPARVLRGGGGGARRRAGARAAHALAIPALARHGGALVVRTGPRLGAVGSRRGRRPGRAAARGRHRGPGTPRPGGLHGLGAGQPRDRRGAGRQRRPGGGHPVPGRAARRGAGARGPRLRPGPRQPGRLGARCRTPRCGTATISKTWPRSMQTRCGAPGRWRASPPAGCRSGSRIATPRWRPCSGPSCTA